MEISKLPIGEWIEQVIEFLTNHIAFLTHFVSSLIEAGLDLFVEWVMYVSALGGDFRPRPGGLGNFQP